MSVASGGSVAGGGGATAVVATVVAMVTGRATAVVTVGVVVLEEERSLESCNDRYDKAPAASSIKMATIHAGERRRRRCR